MLEAGILKPKVHPSTLMTALAILLVAVAVGHGRHAHGQTSLTSSERLGERICWLMDTRFQNEAAFEKAKMYLRRAKKTGYTAVVLANTKWLAMPGAWGEDYQRRLRGIGEEAERLGLGLIPYVTNFGSGGSLLSHEPNLAEGMPVKNALFSVEGSEARSMPDPPIKIVSSDFERAEGNKFVGWRAETANVGVSVFADSDVFHSGKLSVRMQSFKDGDKNGRCRLTQTIRLTPFRQYRMTVWIKTQDLKPADQANVSFWTGERHLCYTPLEVKSTQDWTLHHFVFNSQKYGQVLLRVGIESRGESGKVWFDDLSVEEIGLLNVLRRPGCPIIVRGEDGTAYEEGRDFEPVRDPKLGRLHPWGGYSFGRQPPPLHLTKSSRIREGQHLRISFFHAAAVYRGQVSVCLSCPRAYEFFEKGIEQVDELVHPVGYHISCGEIRTANWDDACQERHLTPAQLLSDSVHRRIAGIRKVNARARIYAWSDMFDPWHNARDNYYLCNGSWVGAWYGVPKDVIIMNWNYTRLDGKSPRFFADNGFSQIILGRGPDVADWLRSNPDVPNIVGVLNFIAPSLEAFAASIWGTGQ